jgi:hypothetical protein
VQPDGALVLVNGEKRGLTPAEFELLPGAYAVQVQSEGYASWLQDIKLLPGQDMVVVERLQDIAAPQMAWSPIPASVQVGQAIHISVQVQDNGTVMGVRLLVDDVVVAELDGQILEYTWETAAAAPGDHSLVIEADDDAGNRQQMRRTTRVLAPPTPEPTATPPPVKPAVSALSAYETSVTLSAYPFAPYLRERTDPRYNFRVVWLDRAVYEATGPHPEPRAYRAVVLENRYLSLVFLPDLGGRLYRCVWKATGQNIFYANRVVKPSFWGPLSRDENWWLAMGGMEWAVPVHEHGYEWGLPWSYRLERQADAVSIVLRDSQASDRLQVEIRVTLPAERAYFVLEPRLLNPTAQAVNLQFWLNAALTLGSASASANTEFVYPTGRMIVHSTGDPALPGERQEIPWPLVDGRDLSRYGNWDNWLGVFVPDTPLGYVGAYSHDTDLGIVRVFPPQVVPGLKLFAFGAGFPARMEYSDDGSDYFEMWGGPCRTFWPEDDLVLQPEQVLQWQEVWAPFVGIGGLDVATAEAVLRVKVQGNQVHLGIAVSKVGQVRLQLLWNEQRFHQEWVDASPDKSFLVEIALPDGAAPPGQLTVRLEDGSGAVLLEHVQSIA